MTKPDIITSEEIGRLLKACRARRGLSLREVAEETGVSASTLSRCENGEGEMDAHTIAVMAGYLDIPLQRINGEQFVYFQREPMPQIVDSLLATDKKLSAESRDCLFHIFGLLTTDWRERHEYDGPKVSASRARGSKRLAVSAWPLESIAGRSRARMDEVSQSYRSLLAIPRGWRYDALSYRAKLLEETDVARSYLVHGIGITKRHRKGRRLVWFKFPGIREVLLSVGGNEPKRKFLNV